MSVYLLFAQRRLRLGFAMGTFSCRFSRTWRVLLGIAVALIIFYQGKIHI